MHHYDTETMWDDEGEEEGRGRSKRKREAQALTELGKKLTELEPSTLASFQLPAELQKAIEAAQSMKFAARKRQIKFIGGLLRRMDTEAIEAAMGDLENHKHILDADFHLVEQWRDRLLSDSDAALTELMGEHPNLDTTRIRQLLRNARREQQSGKPGGAAKQLFRLLRESFARKDDFSD